MDKELQDRLKETITDALSTICRKDETGMFYEEIYADYRDEIDNRTMKKICDKEKKRNESCNLSERIGRGYRTGLKKETMETLTSHNANLMISLAQENERKCIRVEGYIPRAPLKIGASKTERQTE